MCKYNTSIFYSLRFVHRTTQMEFPPFVLKDVWSQVFCLISDMFQGVEYFSISQARPGETFLSDRAGSKWWFSMRGNLPKMIQPSQTIRVFYHIVESLYVSIASFQYRTGNMVGRSPEFANLRLNGSAQQRTTSSMEGWCVSTDHPTVTLILVNGVWVQYIESIKIVVFVLRVRVATISVQWLFLLHWYHHFFLIENDSWCEVHDGMFPLF